MRQCQPLCTRISYGPICWALFVSIAIGVLSLALRPADAWAQADDATDEVPLDGEAEEPKEVIERDPIVMAFRRLDPSTLSQLTRAVEAMQGIRRPDEARVYLAKIKSFNPSDMDLANLAREFGGRLFLNLRADADLAPEGSEFADLVLAAYGTELNDSARLAGLAVRRAGGERGTLQGLVEAGQPAVPAVIGELAKATDEATQARLITTLVKIGSPAVNPLTAALRSGDETLVSGAARTLAELGDGRAAKHLIGPSWDEALSEATREDAYQATVRLLGTSEISRADAERYLVKKVLNAYRGDQGVEVSEYDDAWVWDTASGNVRKLPRHRAAGSSVLAAKLAADLAKLRPQDGPVQDLAISARLAAAKALVEPGSPLIVADGTLYAEVQRLEPDQLARVLAYSLKNHQAAAATAVCEVLGQVGPSLVENEGAMSPLLQSLRSPNRRLQFAACRAIMETSEENTAFAGSSRWLDRVGYFIRSQGVEKAIVADTVAVRGRTLVGMLNEQGTSSVAVKNGTELIAAVVKDPDVELILIHENLNRPLIAETLQILRGDYRMRAIPVAILKDGGDDLKNDRLAENDPLTIAVPMPVSPEYLSVVVGRLHALNRSDITEVAERHRQAEVALGWVERRTQDGDNRWQLEQIEDSIHVALGNPDLAIGAAELMGRLANVRSQRRLLELINNDSESEEARTAALDAFQATIESKGILLGGSEIRAQMNLAKTHRNDSMIQEGFAMLLTRLTKEK